MMGKNFLYLVLVLVLVLVAYRYFKNRLPGQVDEEFVGPPYHPEEFDSWA